MAFDNDNMAGLPTFIPSSLEETIFFKEIINQEGSEKYSFKIDKKIFKIINKGEK